MKPSITCADCSLEKPTCSCTCTKGIIFNQPLPLTSLNGSSTPPDSCQAEKQQWLECERQLSADISQANQDLLDREQELTATLNVKQQELLTREQELAAQMTEKQ